MSKPQQLLNLGRQIDQRQRAISLVDCRNLKPNQCPQPHAVHITHIGQVNQDRSALRDHRLHRLSQFARCLVDKPSMAAHSHNLLPVFIRRLLYIAMKRVLYRIQVNLLFSDIAGITPCRGESC